jgi:hypothetical protein
MTSPSASDNFNIFLEREIAEQKKEKWKKLDDQKYFVRKRFFKGAGPWRRLLSRLFRR